MAEIKKDSISGIVVNSLSDPTIAVNKQTVDSNLGNYVPNISNNSGKVLTTTDGINTSWGTSSSYIEYVTPGSYTFTIPNNARRLGFSVTGAGGGGANGTSFAAGGGGGGGAYASWKIPRSFISGSTISVTVGQGGSSGVPGGSSSISSSSFNVFAPGGSAGTRPSGGTGASILNFQQYNFFKYGYGGAGGNANSSASSFATGPSGGGGGGYDTLGGSGGGIYTHSTVQVITSPSGINGTSSKSTIFPYGPGAAGGGASSQPYGTWTSRTTGIDLTSNSLGEVPWAFIPNITANNQDVYLAALTISGLNKSYVLRSTDTIVWSNADGALNYDFSGAGSINAVNYGGIKQFYVFNFYGCKLSTDGIVWQSRSSLPSGPQVSSSVFASDTNPWGRTDGLIVAGGSVNGKYLLCTTGNTGISGDNWVVRTVPTVHSPSTYLSLDHVLYGNINGQPTFVTTSWAYHSTLGYISELITSTDSITWTLRTIGVSMYQKFSTSVFAKNTFLLSNSSYLVASTDGIVWRLRTTGDQNESTLTAMNPSYLTIGSDNYFYGITGMGRLFRSTDSISWSVVYSSQLPVSGPLMQQNNKILIKGQQTTQGANTAVNSGIIYSDTTISVGNGGNGIRGSGGGGGGYNTTIASGGSGGSGGDGYVRIDWE